MASIASVVRLSSRQSAVWRVCAGCDALAPLPPAVTHCPDCTDPVAAAPSALRRTAHAA